MLPGQSRSVLSPPHALHALSEHLRVMRTCSFSLVLPTGTLSCTSGLWSVQSGAPETSPSLCDVPKTPPELRGSGRGRQVGLFRNLEHAVRLVFPSLRMETESWPPRDAHVLIPEPADKGFRWHGFCRDDPGLSMWTQCTHKGPYKREVKSQRQKKEMQ